MAESTREDTDRREVGHDTGDRALPVPLSTAARLAWRFLVVSAALALFTWFVAHIHVATIPLLLALILAAIFIPPARWLEQHGWNAGLATFTVLLGILVIVVGVFAFVLPQFVSQLGQLQEQLGQATEQLSGLLPGGVLSQANLQLGQVQEQVFSLAQENLGQLMRGAVALLKVIVGALLTLVLLFFFMKDRDQITAWLLRHVPNQHREEFGAAAARAWETLSGYFRGVVIIAAIDAIGIGIGLFFIGVPLVFPLMVLVFVGAFFPVVGAFVAGLVAVLVAFVGGGVLDAALTLGVIVVVQQIEGNILQPVIMRRTVPLHPIVVLFALTGGGVLAGISGAFFAVPVVAVITAAGGELFALQERRSTSET